MATAPSDSRISVEFLSTAYLGEKGQVTIPKPYRDSLTLETGAPIAIVKIGAGLLLIPEQARFLELCDRISRTFARHGVSPEDVLSTLDETREKVFSELYPGGKRTPKTRKAIPKKRP